MVWREDTRYVEKEREDSRGVKTDTRIETDKGREEELTQRSRRVETREKKMN